MEEIKKRRVRQPTKYKPGEKWGRLTILSEYERCNQNKRRVVCLCECGNETIASTNNLVSGNTTSCGCYGQEARQTHGLSKSRVYNIHEGMLRRCKPTERNLKEFKYHAAKGVKVCDRWNPEKGGSFENFFEDMGHPPEGTSLDRIDVNGDYTPENCRWADASIQGYNKNKDPNNTSGKTGVSFYTRNQKWSAEIHFQSKHIRLGLFENFEDAVKAREEAELKYYGWKRDE